MITGEADYPTEVKAREPGINLILGGHRETEVFGVRELAALIRVKMYRFRGGLPKNEVLLRV
jgi:putative NIF3 family GTP cyclohydrolase 1 type 2